MRQFSFYFFLCCSVVSARFILWNFLMPYFKDMLHIFKVRQRQATTGGIETIQNAQRKSGLINRKLLFVYYRRNFSKLEMYFKRPRFISMRRSELFGVTDFLANCGGLLGLFLGFSFLSLVEIFYFLTLR